MSRFLPILKQLSHRIRAVLENDKQRMNLLLVLGLTGMLLIACSEYLPDKAQPREAPNTTQPATQDYAAELEQRLQQIIMGVEGAGETEVMVTLLSGEQTMYAADTEQSADGGSATRHVLLGGSEAGLVESVAAPQLLGVAVVCAGGGDPGVQSRVTAMVKALTGLGSNHITVIKRAAGNR